MPRKARERSKTGIYHVILRGINKQDIFHDEDDYLMMTRTLASARQYKGCLGQLKKDGCEIYAYCIMPNHMHILLKENMKSIGRVMQRIEDSFVYYYNYKYERIGPLFQSRYLSEPVCDKEHFIELMRFIHNNPVRAGLCSRPEEYKYSSWREYHDVDEVTNFVCSTFMTLQIAGNEEFVHSVCEGSTDKCMDIGEEKPVINDKHAWKMLSIISSCDTPDEFRRLSSSDQIESLKRLYRQGVSLRQAARLSSLSYYMIRKNINPGSGDE